MMLAFLRRFFGGSAGAPHYVVRAKYDAAQTTDHNARHWMYADALSARQANSLDVRTTLRNRARYEVANNCHLRGMIATKADLVVGTGGQLQIAAAVRGTTKAKDDRLVERLFGEWADAVDLWPALHTACMAKIVDGEGPGLIRYDDRVDSPVPIRVQTLETEHFTSGTLQSFDPLAVDGVVQSESGEVLGYHVSPRHPAEQYTQDLAIQYVPSYAGWLWYRVERPGQQRGVPEITAALPLCAELRAWRHATLDAARTAANFTVLLQTEGPGPLSSEGNDWEVIDLERNAMMRLPRNVTASQMRAEHPSTSFVDGCVSYLTEIGHSLGLPRVLSLGDASQYNYSSVRLDLQLAQHAIDCDRDSLHVQVLAKIWAAWLREAQLIEGYLPASWRTMDAIRRRISWRWKNFGHVDREKESAGAAADIANGFTTLAHECAARNLDWEDVLEQQAIEQQRRMDLGLMPDTDEWGYESMPSEEEGDDAGV